MNLTRKRIGSLLLAVCMVLTLLPLTAVPAYAASAITTLKVGGTTYEAGIDQSGTGWSWDTDSNTFTLSGNITGDILFQEGTGDVTFVVSGSPTVSGQIRCSTGKLTVTGGGSDTLNVSYTYGALYAYSMEIVGLTVNASSASYGAAVEIDGDFTMSSGTLNLTASISTGLAAGDITIDGTATVTTTAPTGAYAISAGNLAIGGNATVDVSSGGIRTLNVSDSISISDGSVTVKNINFYNDAIYSENGGSITGGILTTGTSGGTDGSVNANLTVSGASTQVTVNGSIVKHILSDSLTVLAGAVTINGDVESNANISGGTVTINGNIGSDANISGGTVTVTGTVAGNQNLTGGSVSVNGVQVYPDITAPVLSGGTASRYSATTAWVFFTSSETGKYYYTIASTPPGTRRR